MAKISPDDVPVYCKGVKKVFRAGGMPTHALRGIDFVAADGQMMLLVGPSGSGKTTLLSVIAAILDADGGDVRVFGTKIHDLNDSERADFRSKNVGFIFQQFNLIPTLNVVENIAVPLRIQGVPRKVALMKAQERLEQVGIGERSNSYPTEMSGGQQQRVAIARALVSNPRLIVCDEPTSALDGETGGKVMQLLRSVAVTPGRCVLVVTHDPRIYKWGDWITEMVDGRIVSIRRVEEVLATPSAAPAT